MKKNKLKKKSKGGNNKGKIKQNKETDKSRKVEKN